MPDIFISPEEKQQPEKPSEKSEKTNIENTANLQTKTSFTGQSHSKLSAFCLYPGDIDFETRDTDEQIVLLLRRHPITNLKWILTSLFLLAGPTVLGFFGVFSMMPTGFPLVISLAWYLVTSAYAIESFLDWYFSVYFITTKRVVDVDFYNLIDKKVSDAELDKIQDTSYVTSGVIRTMFNYGDVLIQTASEVTEFEFEAVPNPEKVAKVLSDLMEKV